MSDQSVYIESGGEVFREDDGVFLEEQIAIDIQFRLTGGGDNTNPNASLGGLTSAFGLAADALDNLFDDVSSAEAAAGDSEYRAFSVVQAGTQALVDVIFDLEASPQSTVWFFFEGKNLGAAAQTITNESTSPTLGAHGRFQLMNGVIERTGQAQGDGGGTNTLQIDSGAPTQEDEYYGWMVEITAGAGFGQRRRIIAYVAATKTLVVHADWAVPVNATSQFAVQRRMYLGALAESDDCRIWMRRNIAAGAANRANELMTLRVEGA